MIMQSTHPTHDQINTFRKCLMYALLIRMGHVSDVSNVNRLVITLSWPIYDLNTGIYECVAITT
jgi:hypothetical protein